MKAVLGVTAVCWAGAAVAAEAPVVFLDEGFSDGELTGGADPMDASWYEGGGATPSIIDDSIGLGVGNALQYISAGNFSRVTAAFESPLELAMAGDLISVELRLRMTRFSVSNDGGIRFGLHHDNAEPITEANVGQNWSDLTDGWDGYYFRGGVGTTAGMRIYKDVPMVPDPFSPGAMGGNGDITVGNGTGWVINDEDVHTVRIEVLRTDNNQNLLRFFWDDDLKQEVPTATAGGEMDAFTNFTLGTGGTEVDLLVDDVKITVSEGNLGPVEPIDLEARLVDWQRAGVEGDIPEYTNVIDFVAAGGDSLGQTNSSPLLQDLLRTLREDSVIYFPAGVFRFDRRIEIDRQTSPSMPGVIFRGAGTKHTKLLFMDPVPEFDGLFHMQGYETSGDISISDGLSTGSTTLTLESTTGVNAGAWLWVRQNNDFDAMATIRDIPDYLDSINNNSGWAKRSVGQVVKVTAVDGNAITIDRPLHLDFLWENPTATVFLPVTGVGFEDFTLENTLETQSRTNFRFINAVNCWVKNVHSLMAMRNHVAAFGCANLTVRDSYFLDAWRHDGGGHGYGTLLADATTHCLVENNVFRELRHSMIWKEGANGNVFAYNYSTDGNQDGSPVAKDISGHGHYAFANLLEGNIVQFIHAADYWGPIGPHNMFLRNRATDERILIEDGTKDQSIIGNELTSATSPFVVVDNTSTGAFVHGNNEGGLIQWREGEEQTVVDSYFYDAEPAFWTIDDSWPSIGPEHSAGANTIPAKYRWDNELMELFVPPAPVIESKPASVAANAGGGVTFAVEAVAHGATYQWKKNGVDLVDGAGVSGATTATLVLDDVSLEDAGSYAVEITNGGGVATSAAAFLSLWSPDAGKLANLSTRGEVLSGDDILIGGFVIAGNAPKTMLIRGIGPSLGQFVGAGKAVVDSVISVFSGPTEILSNDDWGTQAEAGAIELLSAELGAFPLESESKDAVVRAELSPGSYSVHVSGKGGAGLALAELYDGGVGADSRLINISTRGRVGSGDSIMVPGIVVTESSSRLLIRGVGPELAASFGFAAGDVLADPVLTVKDRDGVTVATNDNWSAGTDAPAIVVVSEQVGAFPLTVGSADAVLLVEAPPGTYTALLSDASGGEGIAIVEVYAAP